MEGRRLLAVERTATPEVGVAARLELDGLLDERDEIGRVTYLVLVVLRNHAILTGVFP